jgi:hypothetical protein
MEISKLALDQATEACKDGCANPPACEAALVQALHAANAALTQPSDDSGLSRAAASAEALQGRFDGIAKLSQTCVKRAESAPKAQKKPG